MRTFRAMKVKMRLQMGRLTTFQFYDLSLWEYLAGIRFRTFMQANCIIWSHLFHHQVRIRSSFMHFHWEIIREKILLNGPHHVGKLNHFDGSKSVMEAVFRVGFLYFIIGIIYYAIMMNKLEYFTVKSLTYNTFIIVFILKIAVERVTHQLWAHT